MIYLHFSFCSAEVTYLNNGLNKWKFSLLFLVCGGIVFILKMFWLYLFSLLFQLVKDYKAWATGDASRQPLGTGKIWENLSCFNCSIDSCLYGAIASSCSTIVSLHSRYSVLYIPIFVYSLWKTKKENVTFRNGFHVWLA